jgi:RluA family pseudouridine synthase
MSPTRELVIYNDEQILAAAKPAGMDAVPGGWTHDTPSLLERLEDEYGRLWIVHRLDKGTSGLIVFARTPEAHRTLSLLFETRAVSKTYHAIVNGCPAWTEHTARHLLRANVGHSHRTVVDPSHGKPSKTAFRLLERFKNTSLLEAAPHTGRTHQIRAHLSALGFPVLADTLYHAPATDLIGRPALHAYSLAFEFENKPFSMTAPYPEDFKQALNKLRAGQ